MTRSCRSNNILTPLASNSGARLRNTANTGLRGPTTSRPNTTAAMLSACSLMNWLALEDDKSNSDSLDGIAPRFSAFAKCKRVPGELPA